ncbi:retinol dehydrogenase 16-like isoform X2 [Lytechinus pictus]
MMSFLSPVMLLAALTVGAIVAKIIEYFLRRPYVDNITKDKYVFITGCDTGFGNKLAKQLDTKGVHVIAACLTEKGRRDLDDVTSGRVKTLLLDVTDHDSVAKAYGEVLKIIPHERALWGVVNNAGVSNIAALMELSKRQDYEKVLAVNLFGVIDVTLTFLPLLKKSSGRLVNVASCAGRLAALPGGYSESKFAVEAFSDNVRRDRRNFGYSFKVSIIEPGFFDTYMASKDHLTRNTMSLWNRLSNEEKREFPETVVQKFIDEKGSLLSSMVSSDFTKVTDAIEHALFSTWPKTRYAVGWDANLIWMPMSYAPTWIQDKLCP